MEKVVADFWKNKKVFLSGHTGFKGSWLSLWLTKMGADVTGYALEARTNPSLFEAAGIANYMRSIHGDVRDLEKITRSLRESNAEIVIHMAAQPIVRRSYANPVETYTTNVIGTVNIHEAVRVSDKVRVLLNVTSDKCYENKERIEGYREDEALGGYDPYSSSKACSELITSAYRQSYGICVASARAGNVIGGGDWATDRLLPDIFRALTAKKEILIRNPQAVRPWQHVLEPLSGYLLVAQKLFTEGSKYATAYNFGPDAEDVKNVEWIVKRIIECWGEGAGYKVDDGNHPHEAKLLMLDPAKAKDELGWAPRWKLSDALPRIVEWFKTVAADSSKAREITLRQIEEFEAKAH